MTVSASVLTMWVPLVEFPGCQNPPQGDRASVTPKERKRIIWLCLRIQEEKESKTFDQLVHESNELLEIKHERIHPEHKTNPNQNPSTQC
jgi:hypothetical protein